MPDALLNVEGYFDEEDNRSDDEGRALVSYSERDLLKTVLIESSDSDWEAMDYDDDSMDSTELESRKTKSRGYDIGIECLNAREVEKIMYKVTEDIMGALGVDVCSSSAFDRLFPDLS